MFSYTISNDTDPISREIIESNRRELAFWRRLTPDDDADLATVIHTLSTRTAFSRQFIAASLFTVRFLEHLPRFSEVLAALGHLDMARLNTITRAAAKIPATLRELFDAHLADYLSPSREHQVLPQPSSIAAMLRKFRQRHAPEPDQGLAADNSSLSYRRRSDGTVRIALTAAADEAVEIRGALNSMATDQQTTPGGALLNIVRGLDTQVVLHAYGPGEPEYLEGAGWLNQRQQELWKNRVTKCRNLGPVACSYTAAYRPTPEMRAYIRGRDATCRVPGCTVEAANCDIDHIIAHGDGGPTTPWNLQCICRFHHNMKTSGRLQCYPLPDGDILFVLDGRVMTSSAQGPLSQSHRTWGTSFGAYMDRRAAA